MSQYLKTFVAGACVGAATVCVWGAASAQLTPNIRHMAVPLAVAAVGWLIGGAGWWVAAESEGESKLS